MKKITMPLALAALFTLAPLHGVHAQALEAEEHAGPLTAGDYPAPGLDHQAGEVVEPGEAEQAGQDAGESREGL